MAARNGDTQWMRATSSGSYSRPFWKSVKDEAVYLHASDAVAEARRSRDRYFPVSNQARPPSAREGQTPDMVYFTALPQREAA